MRQAVCTLSDFVEIVLIPFLRLCVSGVLRVEAVPGAMLGLLPCWRLLPEAVRGSAWITSCKASTSGGGQEGRAEERRGEERRD